MNLPPRRSLRLVAGIDFGTAFTKVVVRNDADHRHKSRVITFPHIPNGGDGLLPSELSFSEGRIQLGFVPGMRRTVVTHLKMIAARVAGGHSLRDPALGFPSVLCDAGTKGHSERDLVRGLLAFYLARVMLGVEAGVRTCPDWHDFNPRASTNPDTLTHQLAVPTGLLNDGGASEWLFRESFFAAQNLRTASVGTGGSVELSSWLAQVAEVCKGDWKTLLNEFPDEAIIYPETAAAMQGVSLAPDAQDGYYLTLDVGAGTADLNLFHRWSKNPDDPGTHLNFYAAKVAEYGLRTLKALQDAPGRTEFASLMAATVPALVRLAQIYLGPNVAANLGDRLNRHCHVYLFGGAPLASGLYRLSLDEGLRLAHMKDTKVRNLPCPENLALPNHARDPGRFAVAYGLSFPHFNLDKVKLPDQLRTYRDLYPDGGV